MGNKKLLIIICPFLFVNNLYSQDKVIVQLPAKYFEGVSRQTNALQQKLGTKSQKVLVRMKRAEDKLRKKVAKIDTLAANDAFTDAKTTFKLPGESSTDPKPFSYYEPLLDSLITAFKFLEESPEWLNGARETKEELKHAFEMTKELGRESQKAGYIRQFLLERKQFLYGQLGKFQFVKELKKINKVLYYYAQQVNQYRWILRDPGAIQRKVIEYLSKTKQFRDFFRKHSMLASLFPLAGDPDDPGYMTNLAGLQTRAQVNFIIQNQVAVGGGNAQQQFSMNLQAAHSQLNQLKDKICQSGGESSGDIVPENFKPNNQKGKSFWQRIELGSTMQSQRATNLFPLTSDIGLSIAYKFSNEAAAGLGTCYKLGWGKGWNNVRITHQGFAFRTFIDYKLKGSVWVTGGYEHNYKSLIRNIDQLRNQSSWQKSGLIGISKVIPVKSKLFRITKLQLLWDFLSYSQIPATPPILFRIGHNIK